MNFFKDKLIIILSISFFIFIFFSPLSLANYQKSELLISPTALKEKLELDNNKLKIIDVRSSLNYLLAHIPGAVNLQPANFSNDKAWVSGLIAEPQNFNFVVAKKGIHNDSEIIIYADQNQVWPTRLWFIFKLYGKNKVRILKGGLKAWKEEDFALERMSFRPQKGDFVVNKVNNDLLINTDTIAENLNNKDFLIVDTRPKAEFLGQNTTAKAQRQGRIPNSVHLDWQEFLDQNNNFKSIAVIKEILAAKGINKNKETIVFLSREGVEASFSFFTLKLLGYNNLKLYDDSWLGWSQRKDLPIQ
ncbi:sulfurtransferase [Halanaerobium praevalens]|uniref:thiosulfate sulfurtransferase n=1 Tax=Halanaerobium praevalens (strain ATCC 33744 / DSM 2228 / GSL) TaxID=572479 RepID=E3DQP5_HALPG|nr:sulfurtransferase [Halanaerobium praevalens]ADO77956.1 Rhodanese domain protein [Halanaerobium praevalens DSM 2228]